MNRAGRCRPRRPARRRPGRRRPGGAAGRRCRRRGADARDRLLRPVAAAAQLEGSKAFAKDVMAAAGVPTARAYVCTTPDGGRRRRWTRSGRRTSSRTTGSPPARASSSPTTARRRWRTPRRAGASSSRSSSTAPRCRCSPSPTGTTVDPAAAGPGLQAARRRRHRAQHRRHGRLHAAAVGAAETSSTRSIAPVAAADRRRDGRRGTPFAGAALRRPRPDVARRPGGRVQRAVRRPRDPGRAGSAAFPAGRLLHGCGHRRARPTCRRCGGPTPQR